MRWDACGIYRKIAQRCIAATTGQIILDPFMGSGTTALAADILKRQWVGIERSGQYCTLAQERISANKELM